MAADGFAEELKKKIGLDWPPVVYDIEKGMIRRFAQAVGDPNPLWQDDEYARMSNYGGIIAPPTFALIMGFDRMLQSLDPGSSLTVLHGSTELECYQPIRPGDVITVTTRIANVRQRQGKTVEMLFVTFDISCRNQGKELVARCHQMAIIY
jgi:acyl dehydratase